MLDKRFDHGFSEDAWAVAKVEARDAMITVARRKNTISYSDLVSKIEAISLDPYDKRLFVMLGEISEEEDAAGRSMLTAVVVHKHGDMQPGPGFFELAEELGKDTSDILACWSAELGTVFDAWSDRRR